MLDEALKNASVTVACITYGTSSRNYINYEIDKPLEKGNGLLGIYMHHLKDQYGKTGSRGEAPAQILANDFKTYDYTNKDDLAEWIEEAAKLAKK